MISVQVNDKQVLAVLAQLSERAQNLRPAFAEIGEDMVESTKRRFATATAPDGTPWAPNSPVTVARYLGIFKNTHNSDGSLRKGGGDVIKSALKKDGTLSKSGQARSAAKKPLTGETRALQTTINYQLQGAHGVSIGSPMVYAAMQQFGGTKSQFPQLWGDIPARPFLGVSATDKTNILDILGSYLVK